MSNPSFENIDLWLFELAEGNLTDAQIEQLEMFILQHPELDIERDAWDFAKVKKNEVQYTNTDQHIRRRPVALYTAAGVTAVFFLTFLGCYQYLDLNPTETHQVIAKKTSKGPSRIESNEIDEMRSEINELKQQVAELKELNEELINEKNGGYLSNSSTRSEIGNEAIEGSSAGSSSGLVFSESGINRGTETNFSGSQSGNGFAVSGGTEGQEYLNNAITASSLENSAGTYDRSASDYEIRMLKPRKATIIDYEPGWQRSAQSSNSSKKSGGKDMHLSFKSKLDRMARSVQRMMDNPIALKNSRDPHYHVPGVLPQDVNFGAVGTLLTTRVQTMSRIQWLGQPNQQLMNQLAVDGYSYGVRGGFGIQLNHTMYKDGAIHVGDVALTYSPKFSITNVISVEPSVRFKMGNKLIDHKKMEGVTNVEMDRGNVFDYYANGATPYGNNLWYKDLGAGIMVNTKWFFVGIQGDNLFHHKDDIYSNDITNQHVASTEVFATVGTDWESRTEKMMLSPYFVFHQNDQLTEGWLGMNFRWNWITVGGAISTDLEPAASIGLKFKHFAITYNGDYVNSSMLGNKSLSHQVSLRVLGKTNRVGRRILSY